MKVIKLSGSVILLFILNLNSFAQHNHSGMGSGQGSGSNSVMNMGHDHREGMEMAMPMTVTESFRVSGNCEKCRNRILDIAFASGAIDAGWDKNSKLLTVRFNPAKSGPGYIGGKLAKAGYDNYYRKAKAKAYETLPECCKYEREKKSSKS